MNLQWFYKPLKVDFLWWGMNRFGKKTNWKSASEFRRKIRVLNFKNHFLQKRNNRWLETWMINFRSFYLHNVYHINFSSIGFVLSLLIAIKAKRSVRIPRISREPQNRLSWSWYFLDYRLCESTTLTEPSDSYSPYTVSSAASLVMTRYLLGVSQQKVSFPIETFFFLHLTGENLSFTIRYSYY